MKYVNLVIDNKSDHTDRLYTYGCRDEEVAVGQKVYVPFAKGNRLREAYVDSFAESLEEGLEQKLKYVENVHLSHRRGSVCYFGYGVQYEVQRDFR